MNIKTMLIASLSAVMLAALITISISSPAALAQKSNNQHGSIGLEVADEKVHHTPGGFTGQQDVNFHTGICQGGHSTEALDLAAGGCGGGFIQSPSQLGSGHNGK
jgi:hypothetical protein